MLGGDDLLLVCRASYALPFMVKYAKHLASEDLSLPDGKHLTIGAGVVIASHNFPFHHLHKLAEQLATSAKRHSCYPDASVIDWMVCTYSWSEDPIAVRRRDEIVSYEVSGKKEVLTLSSRPYRVLQDMSSTEKLDSLQALIGAADRIGHSEDPEGQAAERSRLRYLDPEERKAARSQLRYLVDELSRGKRWAELCFEEMPELTRGTLKDIGIKMPWISVDGEALSYRTPLADLVEVCEIPHLGYKKARREARK